MSDVFADDTTELYPVPDLDKERPYAIPLMRPLPIHRLEVCLINFNKVFKILQYSEMECNYVRTITTGLLGKHSIGPRLQPIEPIGKSGTDCTIIHPNQYMILTSN
jgi:hypothetical protein